MLIRLHRMCVVNAINMGVMMWTMYESEETWRFICNFDDMIKRKAYIVCWTQAFNEANQHSSRSLSSLSLLSLGTLAMPNETNTFEVIKSSLLFIVRQTGFTKLTTWSRRPPFNQSLSSDDFSTLHTLLYLAHTDSKVARNFRNLGNEVSLVQVMSNSMNKNARAWGWQTRVGTRLTFLRGWLQCHGLEDKVQEQTLSPIGLKAGLITLYRRRCEQHEENEIFE